MNSEPVFRTSSYTNGCSSCVEVAMTGDTVIVRDTKILGSPELTFTLPEWRAFVLGTKDGEFDI